MEGGLDRRDPVFATTPATIALLTFALLAAACTSSADEPLSDDASIVTTEPTDDAASDTTTPTTAAAPSTSLEVATPVATVTEITIDGEPEVVFDWTTDQCEPENIPDISARAYRDAGDNVHLSIGHYVNYRMTGPTLDTVEIDCSGPVMTAEFDPDPSQFNDSEWIAAPYTFDGQTIFAIVHNEYRGDTHRSARPGQCPSGQRLTCLDTSVTMAISSDQGATFRDLRSAPDHMVATLPFPFDDQGVPSGLRQPSNIIEGPDGYLYVFTNVSNIPDEEQWVCAMRTDDLADPDSWRFWTGAAFDGAFIDPYLDDPASADTCAPLAFDQLTGSMNETIVFDETVGKYVMMGFTYHPIGPDPQWGIYYSTSEDLVRWTGRRLLIELPMVASVGDPSQELIYAYPSLLDPDSTSLNFSTTDGDAYLYLTRMNQGDGSLDRDLIRWPISIADLEIEPPLWDFDTDSAGWLPRNELADFAVTDGVLSMLSEGTDPYFDLNTTVVSADLDKFVIRMRISGEGTTLGQLFFTTDDDPALSEDNSVVFVVRSGDDFADYEIDLSDTPGWAGTITSLRIDPVDDAGRTIEIDWIAVTNG